MNAYEPDTPAGVPAQLPAADAVSSDLPATSPVGRLAATVERLRREVRAAQAEAEGRALIELAKGILVERLGCGPAQAARQLAELTEQAQTTPLEFAVEVINQAARDRVAEVTQAFLSVAADRSGPVEESAAVRLRAAESGVLAAHDTQAMADSLRDHALRPLGAVAVAIWSAGSDGSLTLAGSAGVPPGEAVRWHYVPPDVATVARRGLTEPDGAQIHVMGRPELTRLYAAAIGQSGRDAIELDGEQCFLAGIHEIAKRISQ